MPCLRRFLFTEAGNPYNSSSGALRVSRHDQPRTIPVVDTEGPQCCALGCRGKRKSPTEYAFHPCNSFLPIRAEEQNVRAFSLITAFNLYKEKTREPNLQCTSAPQSSSPPLQRSLANTVRASPNTGRQGTPPISFHLIWPHASKLLRSRAEKRESAATAPASFYGRCYKLSTTFTSLTLGAEGTVSGASVRTPQGVRPYTLHAYR